jgi:hypothetical protein
MLVEMVTAPGRPALAMSSASASSLAVEDDVGDVGEKLA